MAGWGYLDANGPATWGNEYLIGKDGKRQSPINIATEKCSSGATFSMQPLTMSYVPGKYLTLTNNGHGWAVAASEEMSKGSLLKGGPLKNEYKLEQFHSHWGKDPSVGSEHTVDGKAYAAELHFVHRNVDLFGSFKEAVDKDKGLSVIGVFVEATSDAPANPELEKLAAAMNLVTYAGQSTNLTSEISVEKLLPANRSYWTYEGSLTTPPLCESVTWIVMKNPIQASAAQLDKFRLLHFNRVDEKVEGCSCIMENFRPVQSICERCVVSVECQ